METATVTVTASRSRWGGWTRSSKSSSHAATSTVRSTTTIVVTTSTSSSSQPTNTGLLSSYAAPILEQHNLHRKNHSAPDLAWDDDLANIAAEIASSCQYAHNVSAGGGGYGQNIGAGAPENEINKMITNQMYNDEIMFYPSYGKEPDMSKFEVWGHFSQIVWKDTTHVGCFTQYCSKGLGGVGSNVSPYFTVCNYKPVGKSSFTIASCASADTVNRKFWWPVCRECSQASWPTYRFLIAYKDSGPSTKFSLNSM